MLPLGRWLKWRYSEESAADEKAAPSVFDVFGTNRAYTDAGTDEDGAEAAGEPPMMRAPSNVTKVVCATCSEPVDMFWDLGAEEWMLRGAVTDSKGGICHLACADKPAGA
jgi:hypothetical protein